MNMQMIKNFVNYSLSLSVYSMLSLLHFLDLLLLFHCQRKFLSFLGRFSFGFFLFLFSIPLSPNASHSKKLLQE